MIDSLELNHIRYGFASRSTLSRIYVAGMKLPQCFMLEDERRNVKVAGKTCIPIGRYSVTLRDEGGMNGDYHDKFPEFHKGMLHLLPAESFDYPFEWVYYHIGNTPRNTLGCPLTGSFPVIDAQGEFTVARSTDAYIPFYKLVSTAIAEGRPVFTNISEAVPI